MEKKIAKILAISTKSHSIILIDKENPKMDVLFTKSEAHSAEIQFIQQIKQDQNFPFLFSGGYDKTLKL